MSQKTLTKEDLGQFTGTEQWYRHGLARNVLYTEGAQHVAESGGAYCSSMKSPSLNPFAKSQPKPFRSVG